MYKGILHSVKISLELNQKLQVMAEKSCCNKSELVNRFLSSCVSFNEPEEPPNFEESFEDFKISIDDFLVSYYLVELLENQSKSLESDDFILSMARERCYSHLIQHFDSVHFQSGAIMNALKLKSESDFKFLSIYEPGREEVTSA